jgi:hypothetical protein
MFFNIIIFFIILITLTLLLKYSKGYKEGFFNFPDETHNQFVEDSAAKFNQLTNTINLADPALPVSPDSANAFKAALGGLTTSITDASKLQTDKPFFIPESAPGTFQQAQSCEKYGATCSAFDDKEFAANCGVSFDNKGIGSNGKPHIGGMYVSAEDRRNQTEQAKNVTETGGAPYDPYKVYQPTLGKSSQGTFSLNKDQCVIVKQKVDCEKKQTFGSPNCTQCYTSQKFARVGPETPRIPSTLFLFGSGLVIVTTPDSASPAQITLSQTTLNANTATQLTIPGNAEGTAFVINVQPVSGSIQTYVAGFIQGQTPRGTFTLDLMNLVQSDLVTNSKPRLNGSITVNGFRCLTMIPGNAQTTMNLSCLMPFSFLSLYDGDALTCDNGPIITQAASATFLESDPCFSKSNKPGNYELGCLQNRWIELGGTPQGTGYPSTQALANAIQIDANGNPLDIDTIVNILAPKMTSALSGLDANGKPLSITEWNTVSMFATGVPINTPCDGPASASGPLSQDCLSYLYLNQGVTSHIGGTYTMPPSQVASMKGQNTPNTYCQPGAPLDPATPAGLKYGQSLGGVNAVKQTYDQINRLANDNTQTNSARAQAVQQCYGVSIDSMTPPNNQTGPTQVFNVTGGSFQAYNIPQAQAQQMCAQYGAQVATTAQLQQAQQLGADWCSSGWVADSNNAVFPVTTSTEDGCGSGSTGVLTYTPPTNMAGVNCYGPKPAIDNYPVGAILPFSQTAWDQPSANAEVFAVTNPSGTAAPGAGWEGYNISQAQAQEVCTLYGAQVATTAQVQQAQQAGADWCYTGWVSDSNTPIFPITTSLQDGCGSGSPGIKPYLPPSNMAGVNCYGTKPAQNDYPSGIIMPFNQSVWSQKA